MTLNELKDFLLGLTESIEEVSTTYLPPEKLTKLFCVAAQNDSKILGCSKQSISNVALTVAQLGLDPSGNTGQLYLIPRKSGLTIIVGYKGLLKLAQRGGSITRAWANVVYSGEEFDWQEGSGPLIRHRPKLSLREATSKAQKTIIAAYACASVPNGTVQQRVMSIAEVEHVKSSGGGGGPWRDHYAAMCMKTAFRGLATWLDLSDEANAQLALVDRMEFPDNHRPTFDPTKTGAAQAAGGRPLSERLGLDDEKDSVGSGGPAEPDRDDCPDCGGGGVMVLDNGDKVECVLCLEKRIDADERDGR